jgi:hypothetical protein
MTGYQHFIQKKATSIYWLQKISKKQGIKGERSCENNL